MILNKKAVEKLLKAGVTKFIVTIPRNICSESIINQHREILGKTIKIDSVYDSNIVGWKGINCKTGAYVLDISGLIPVENTIIVNGEEYI